MSPNRHSIAAVSTAKKFKTPLKASAVLLTSMILAACNTTDDPSYKLNDIFSPLPGASNQEIDKAKAEAEKAKAEAEKAKAEAAEKIAAAEKAAEEKAQAAIKAKEKAEAATAAAEKAKAEAIKAKEEAEKALEEALANGGGSEALQKEAERKAKLAEKAQADAVAAQAAAQAAQQAAEAQTNAAAAAQKVAQEAAAAAEIKNAPESKKSGVQSVKIDATALVGQAFSVTTRDFKATDNSVEARADTASEGLLPTVNITTSGADDTDLKNGFKSHNDSTGITTSFGVLPLTYTSTYKDFGDDMRIGHIDGAAALGETQLPVNGVAVVGNATQAANMPTEGKVGYTGDATYRKTGIGNDIEFGKSVFTADFVAKNVKGDLTFANAGKIGLTAGIIKGNQFSGAAADNAGYNTEGGFFGGDAQYLGGVYEGNGAQGTYGAKSDKQTAADKAAKDAKAKAEATEKALEAAKNQAATAKAAAEKAQAEAAKAKAEAEKAQEAADNASNSGDDQALQDALDRAAAAEAAAEKAKADAKVAIQEAANKAKEEVKAAQDKVAAAQSETAAAKNAATAAKAAADAAEKDAVAKIAAAKSAAEKDVAEAEAAAEVAKAEAKKAKDAQKKAEGDTKAAEDRATAAAAAAAAAEKKAQELQEQLDKLTPKFESAAETTKSGVQHLSIDASVLEQGIKTTTTREFAIRSTSDVDARADLALVGLIEDPIVIKVSGDNDTDTKNGFKSHEDTGTVLAAGDLAYTSVYKDFGANDEMRIAHIDGAAAGGAVPVNGVAVVGNKTATLPTDGTFKYAGDATNRKIGLDQAIEYGSSEFTADFVAKKVDGTLKFAQAGNIALGADIDGNEFSGKKGDYNTDGAFYGKDANYIGGIYEGNGSQGTFGAEKDGKPADLDTPVDPTPTPVNPDVPADSVMTGFQSTALSSKNKTLPFGQGQLVDAIGYVQIRDDKSAWTETADQNGSLVPVDNRNGDNFTSFESGVVLADMVKPDNVLKPISVSLTDASGSIKVDAGRGGLNPTYKYNAVYKNFDSQMQIGHVYGNFNSVAGDVSRAANVYVQGYLTNQQDIDYLKQVNDGKAQYAGVATYIENIHLADNASTAPVDGTSAFNVDFVGNKVDGTLTFDQGDYKYMPTGNKIGISAGITGNTFAGNVGGIDAAGGFYGEDAKFLGGIYQDAGDVSGGKGTGAGTGTNFQGTFGATKK